MKLPEQLPKRIHFQSVSSTNDYARELLQSGESYIAISADHQLNGRGRNGHKWDGDFGLNLYMSLGINHDIINSFSNIFLYQIIGSLAVYKFLQSQNLSNLEIKYPNDLLIRNGEPFKIGGVLAEHSYIGQTCKYSIVGIGVNVNQTKFDYYEGKIATSLKNSGLEYSVEEVANGVIDEFHKLLLSDELKIINNWKSALSLQGKQIKLISDVNGYSYKDIRADGRLILEANGVEKIIDNGDSLVYE